MGSVGSMTADVLCKLRDRLPVTAGEGITAATGANCKISTNSITLLIIVVIMW